MSSELLGTPKQTWPWPDSLDALVTAPGHHSVLLENERIRVVHTHILPGHTVPVHTHRWPSVLFILTWSDVIRLDHLGNVMLDTRKAFEVPKLNTPAWQELLPPHSLKNVGHAVEPRNALSPLLGEAIRGCLLDLPAVREGRTDAIAQGSRHYLVGIAAPPLSVA